MLRSGKFGDKKILLIEKEPKTKNDRTWCFWEDKNGFFEEIAHYQWNKLDFLSDTYSATLDIHPYRYKMIRGIDFYNYCFNEIKDHTNVEVVYGNIDGAFFRNDGLLLRIDKEYFNVGNAVLFNSVYFPKSEDSSIRLLQHFKGWIIETPSSSFDAGKATLMDFRISQHFGTAFVYVLPLTDKMALVEYTLFTESLLEDQQYDIELRDYIDNFLKIQQYTISETEFGVIPMTNEKLRFYKEGVYHIGTAGGQTKASSGYTFQFIQKQSEKIVDCLIKGGEPLLSLQDDDSPRRFRFYDNTLLDILYHRKLSGKEIFTRLFQKNKPQQVLRFLDNESSLRDELKIISSLPTWPFLKAAIRQL
jgi:lycopene beta-cyclase